ncbi:MAG TPA: hypothetical protein DEA31_02305 [Alphaproteobacteria bacterium]|nr:hypothetical protein [Alphaproteobacteria bacterium]
MQLDYLTLLEHTIPYTYVSVLNTPESTEYYIDLTDPDDEEEFSIVLSCQYAGASVGGMNAMYTMYVNGNIAMQATKRILNYAPTAKQNSLHQSRKSPSHADRLENLIRLCSAKVISQEIEARKNHMIKSAFINTNNYSIS